MNYVHYLELRCSPINYTRGDLSEEDVVNIIVDERHDLIVDAEKEISKILQKEFKSGILSN